MRIRCEFILVFFLSTVHTFSPVQSRKFLKVWKCQHQHLGDIAPNRAEHSGGRIHHSASTLGVWIIDEGEKGMFSSHTWSQGSGFCSVWYHFIRILTTLKDNLTLLNRVTQFVGEADTILADSITGKSPPFPEFNVGSGSLKALNWIFQVSLKSSRDCRMGKMQTEKFWLLKALISIMILSDLQSRNITLTLSYLGDIKKQSIL